MFSLSKTNACPQIKPAPAAVLPEVAEATWATWVSLFDRLDTNHDDTVDLRDLRASGLLSVEVCDVIVRLIDPSNKCGFSKRSFLDAMLECFQCRRSGFTLC